MVEYGEKDDDNQKWRTQTKYIIKMQKTDTHM